MTASTTLRSGRLSLVLLDASLLRSMDKGDRESAPFTWPAWWPDEEDRIHVALWHDRVSKLEGNDRWGPRALVNDDAEMVGHAGFHLPPRPVDQALADPSFRGDCEPTPAGAVEIGYTVFPDHRRRGYATEAAGSLVEWAFATGEVTTILATVEPDNVASLAVLDHLGGFRTIGRCRDPKGGEEIVLRRDLILGHDMHYPGVGSPHGPG